MAFLPNETQRAEPRLMATAMAVLAVGCVGLSLLVVGGLRDPLLVGAAQRVVLAQDGRGVSMSPSAARGTVEALR